MIDVIQWTPVNSSLFKNVILRWIKKLRGASERWYVTTYIDTNENICPVCTDTLEADGIVMKRLWVTIPKSPVSDDTIIKFPHVDRSIGRIYVIRFNGEGDIIDAIGEITGKNSYAIGYDTDCVYLRINDSIYLLASIISVLPEKLPDFDPVRITTINYLSHSEIDTIRYGGFVTFHNDAGYKFRITKAAFRVMGVDRPDLPAKFDMGYGFYELKPEVLEILNNSMIAFDGIVGVVVKQTFTDIGFSAYATAIATLY